MSSEDRSNFEALQSIQVNSAPTVPEHIGKHIETEHKSEIAKLFSEQAVEDLSLDDFAQRIKEHGSGHFAIHRGKLGYLDMYLRYGYILPTKLAYSHSQAGKYEERASDPDDRFVPSRALHFSVDKLYTGNYKLGVAFICPVETLIENKTFQGIPLDYVNSDLASGSEAVKNDMPVSGLTEEPLDESHRFNIDGLGILLVPEGAVAIRGKEGPAKYLNDGENWNEEETPSITVEEHVKQMRALGLPCPKKIFFYKGNLQNGIKQFFAEYNLQISPPGRKITTSAPVKLKYTLGGKTTFGHYDTRGEGDFYSVR